jgi:peroxiredoxin
MRTSHLVALLAALLMSRAAWAQEDIGFQPIPEHTIAIAPFSDARVDDLIRTLDKLQKRQTDDAKWAADAGLHFWRFANRLQTGIVSAAQQQKILDYYATLERAHPKDAAFLNDQERLIRTQLIGQTAPEVVGKDYDDQTFKLSDFRGKVVVLVFTGQWCGPCRSEYPYQRLMLEIHKDDQFALVGVNSDADLAVAKQSKIDNHLPYRSWWDGYTEKNTGGPIATAWNVTGWPTIYILDKQGVIRFVNLRHEDVLKAVSQLLQEK